MYVKKRIDCILFVLICLFCSLVCQTNALAKDKMCVEPYELNLVVLLQLVTAVFCLNVCNALCMHYLRLGHACWQ